MGSHPEWANTLFCEIGMNDIAAKYIGQLKFAVPPDHNNHVISKLFDIIITGLNDSSWFKKWAATKGINIFLGPTLEKIKSNQLLTWQYLRHLMTIATVSIEGTAVGQINNNINEIGLDFAKK